MVVVLIVVVGSLVRGNACHEHRSASLFDREAVGQFLEVGDQPVAVPRCPRDGEGAGVLLAPQHRARREASIGLVGAHLDGHISTDAVGSTDHAHHDLDELAHLILPEVTGGAVRSPLLMTTVPRTEKVRGTV